MDGKIRLNDAGRMVERWWRELGKKFPLVMPDAHVVMPNHFHGSSSSPVMGMRTSGAHTQVRGHTQMRPYGVIRTR
jgi:hypothetical protein